MTARPGRRDVLLGAAGAAAVGASGAAVVSASAAATAVKPIPGVLDLYVNDGFVSMVDGSLVYMRGYGLRPTKRSDPRPSLTVSPHVFLANGRLVSSRSYPVSSPLPPHGRPEPQSGPDTDGYYQVRRRHWASFFPERTIVAETGARIRLRVHNRLKEPHNLVVPGVLSTGVIAPGASKRVSVPAPAPGTYLFSDTTNGPVERVLGLHGALVVVFRNKRWQLSASGPEFERQWLWICQDVDPVWALRASRGERIDAQATPPVPRYFMMNGRAGYVSLGLTGNAASDDATHEDTLPSGYPRDTDVRSFTLGTSGGGAAPGQLIRVVNAGVVVHQMHFHGNHVWTVRRNGRDFSRDGRLGRVDEEGHVVIQQWEDVVEVDPLDRKEFVLPLRRPPEVVQEVWEARQDDWHYPMHCHAEPSQSAAGGLYPGGLVADWVLAGRRSKPHPTYRSQADFATSQHKESNPRTEFLMRADRVFDREVFGRKLDFPDGAEHDMWSFEDERSGRSFPAPLIRVTEGELVHVRLKSSKGPHTIHLHGMEPDPRNDGVGHTSYEVGTRYTYQWRPEVGRPGDPNHGAAGAYFYHCHVNTVLHVQMGMVGPLIVDPVVHPDFPVPAGGRRLFVDGPVYDIASELMLAPYSLDPRWHEHSHAAGLSGEDVGLNRFNPRHFYVLGGRIAGGQPEDAVWSPSQVRVNGPAAPLPTLLRVLNMNYFPTRVRFTTTTGDPVRMAELLSHDGRPFRDTTNPGGVARLPRDLDNRLLTAELAFGAAERYEMLLHPPAVGPYLVHFDWYDWVVTTGLRRVATRSLPMTVA